MIRRALRWSAAAVVAAIAPVAPAADFMWDFSSGNLSPTVQNGGAVTLSYFNNADTRTSFGNTATDPNVPDTPGGPTTFLHAMPFDDGGRGGYGLDYGGVGANGGGAYVNNYTVAYDLLVPAINWTALFNTEPGHGNDADFYVAPDGALGIAALGYSDVGVIQPATWHRVVFTHDRTNNRAAYYVDGVERFSGPADALDGRFSLYTADNPGLDLLILGEGDTSGNYTNDIYLGSVFFADRALTSAEAVALGGVTPGGIIVPEPIGAIGVGLLVLLGARGRRPRGCR